MFGYYLGLALRGLKHNPARTALMVVTIGFGVAASMTTMATPMLQSTLLQPPAKDG